LTLLTASEIAAMRATQNAAMPDTGIIIRGNLTPDGMGGFTQGTVAAGTVSGRLMPVSGYSSNEGSGAAQPLSVSKYWWTVPYNTDIVVADMVQVGGQLVRVLEVNLDAGWETAKRCKVEAFNQGAI
jgi:hypothetical protein